MRWPWLLFSGLTRYGAEEGKAELLVGRELGTEIELDSPTCSRGDMMSGDEELLMFEGPPDAEVEGEPRDTS